LDFITGKFDPSTDTSFVLIEKKYADREGMYIKKQAYLSFVKMWERAKEDNISLIIRSATRNFEYQKSIWERKWKGETILSNGENAFLKYKEDSSRALKILEYSSMPGTSRHHWGTDIDLNSFDNKWFEQGEGLAVFNWLSQHASDFGFCRPYTKKDALRPYGYNEEKWHWSYVPLSKHYTEFASQNLHNNDINGFMGSDVCSVLSVVEKYVLGINKNCYHY
jgi:LAS superfamily LD-carboxypeptidase LdcB